MFCQKCGSKLPLDSDICEYCGVKQKEIESCGGFWGLVGQRKMEQNNEKDEIISNETKESKMLYICIAVLLTGLVFVQLFGVLMLKKMVDNKMYINLMEQQLEEMKLQNKQVTEFATLYFERTEAAPIFEMSCACYVEKEEDTTESNFLDEEIDETAENTDITEIYWQGEEYGEE